jgi:hypothetical protein
MPTESCASCGARLSPDVDWCGQCYQPVRTAPAPAPAATALRPAAPAPDVKASAQPATAAGDAGVDPAVMARFDLELASLRTRSGRVSKAEMGGVVAGIVGLALAAEVALTVIHGLGGVLVAMCALGCTVVPLRAMWRKAKAAGVTG